VLPALAAAVVLTIGLLYLQQRDPGFQSEAELVLVPAKPVKEDGPSMLESLDRTGTVETYVEYLGRMPGVSGDGVEIRARQVPGTRVIRLVAQGPRAAVGPALRKVFAQAAVVDARLGGYWTSRALVRPWPPAPSSPSTGSIVLALVLLAGVIAMVVAGLARRRARRPRPRLDAAGLETTPPGERLRAVR
jgi:hypothetical protein